MSETAGPGPEIPTGESSGLLPLKVALVVLLSLAAVGLVVVAVLLVNLTAGL